MSMISALIDELNKSADEWNNSNMFELARMCREAVDTIWQLRDDLQRTNAENAKLREERDMYRDLVGCMVHPDIPDQLHAENAKLRELVRLMWKPYCWAQSGYETCLTDDEDRAIRAKVRELGVEVDE